MQMICKLNRLLLFAGIQDPLLGSKRLASMPGKRYIMPNSFSFHLALHVIISFNICGYPLYY